MKPSIWKDKFDPTAEYVANKKLLFGGRTFEIGEIFDAPTSERQKRTLYDARFLIVNPNPAVIEPEEVPAIGSAIEQQDLPEETETQDTNSSDQDESTEDDSQSTDPDQSEATLPDTNTAPRRLKHVMVSRGWYNVEDADGNVINEKKLRLKDAIELEAQG